MATILGDSAAPPEKKRTKPLGMSQGLHTFKEVVTAFALEQGMPFLPKPGRSHGGKQLYSFGGVAVYLESDVCHVESSKGQWTPVGLEDLLTYCNNRAKSAQSSRK